MPLFDPSPSPLIAVLAFSLYTSLALITLGLHLFAILVLAHGHRYFSQRFFFIVGRHLLAADLLSTVAQLCIAVPVAAMPIESAKTYLQSSFAQFMLTLETLAHLDTFHFVALQACSFLPCFQSERMAFRLNSNGSIIGLVIWMLIAGQMLLFGFVPCAKRFDPITLHFFDSCYWSTTTTTTAQSANAPHGGCPAGLALLNLWLTVLLCTAFFIYTTGLSHVRRRIDLLRNHNDGTTQRESLSVSVVMPTTLAQIEPPPSSVPASANSRIRLSPKSNAIMARKRLKELCRLREMIIQGFLIMLSLIMRFVGFFVLPWLALAIFGPAVANGINQRALINLLANTLILLSVASHSLTYWWWNLKVRQLSNEIVEILLKQFQESK